MNQKSQEIRLLICTANLGNACPDIDSLLLLIPEDGHCLEVCTMEPKYPLQMRPTLTTLQDWKEKEEEEEEEEEEDSAMNNEDDINNNNNNNHRANTKKEMAAIKNNNDRHQIESTIPQTTTTTTNTTTANHQDTTFLQEDQFDMIVFGLQESTFDPPDTMASNVPIGADTMIASILGDRSPMKKTINQWTNLTTNRDHTLTQKYSLPTIKKDINGEETKQQPLQQWHGGTHLLHSLLHVRLPSYGQVVNFQRGEMRLLVWVHEKYLDTVQVLHVTAQNTGRAGLANKGGIVTEVILERTHFSFVTAHLEAHEGSSKYMTRVSTIADILAGTKQKKHDCTLTSHYCFVMGDLNFRTELDNHKDLTDEEHMRIVQDMTDRQDWFALNQIDELNRALRQKDCLVGFQTPMCPFPPTFKVERQKGYVYNMKRRPSYTDRILWKASHGLSQNIKMLVYEPIDDFASSDHKPVRAAFTVKLNAPFLLRPTVTRRGSVMNLNGFMNRRREHDQEVTHKERYHLFLSEIFCSVHSEGKSTPPNQYICLISDPPEALQQKSKKGLKIIKSKLKNTFFGSSRLKTTFVSSQGWPRSSVLKQTFVADWGNEEIHFKVNTHASNGMPIDLSGGILQVTVMDSRSSMDDVVLGSFPFNLIDLIRSCKPTAENVKDRDGSGAMSRSSSVRVHEGNRRNPFFQSIFKRSDNDIDIPPDDSANEPDPIATIEIDEPIYKNGLERGRIKAKIEAWWMDERLAKTFGFGLHNHSINALNNKKTSKREIAGTSENGGRVMLSTRRHNNIREGQNVE